MIILKQCLFQHELHGLQLSGLQNFKRWPFKKKFRQYTLGEVQVMFYNLLGQSLAFHLVLPTFINAYIVSG